MHTSIQRSRLSRDPIALFAALGFFSLIAGCAGGGGDGGGSLNLRLDARSVALEFDQGDATPFLVEGSVSGELDNPATIVIRDPQDGTISTATISLLGARDFQAIVTTNPGLMPGRHEGAIHIDLCNDAVCTRRYTGARLAYAFDVVPTVNRKPLVRLDAVPEWSSFQGGAAHRGYVPVTLEPSRFSSRWVLRLPGYGQPSGDDRTSGVVTGDDRVYFTSERTNTLYAVSEDTGEIDWSHAFALQGGAAINPPATDGSSVFVTTTGLNDTHAWAFDRNSGGVLFQTPFIAGSVRYAAPITVSGLLVTEGGFEGGTVAFETSGGGPEWFYDGASGALLNPAFDGSTLYRIAGRDLVAIDPEKGKPDFTIAGPGASDAEAPYAGPGRAPIPLGNGGDVVTLLSSALVRFDVSGRTVKWSIAGQFMGAPAVAHGLVFAFSQSPGRLEARNVETGALEWFWTPPDDEACFFAAPVAVENLIFASTCAAVHAVDLLTHQSVWSFPHAGELAISPNAVLYISRLLPGTAITGDGRVSAINLQ